MLMRNFMLLIKCFQKSINICKCRNFYLIKHEYMHIVNMLIALGPLGPGVCQLVP